jgi:8-oxo-dGTP pyrophosphatase MutT (NUDIX family)
MPPLSGAPFARGRSPRPQKTSFPSRSNAVLLHRVVKVDWRSVESKLGWRSVASMSSSTTAAKRIQYAALPYRLRGASRTEVMLVTSRGTRRWIIPKGWPQKGKAPHNSAAREAFEEAGVVGAVGKRAVGSFPYQKRLKNGGVTVCEVHVFPLRVSRQSKEWPEKEQREVKWLSAKEAAETVKEPMLGEIIRRLAHKTVD